MKVEYFNGWHKVEDIDGIPDPWYWCYESLGSPEPNGRWFFMNENYYFKEEKDATMFLLRWS